MSKASRSLRRREIDVPEEILEKSSECAECGDGDGDESLLRGCDRGCDGGNGIDKQKQQTSEVVDQFSALALLLERLLLHSLNSQESQAKALSPTPLRTLSISGRGLSCSLTPTTDCQSTDARRPPPLFFKYAPSRLRPTEHA